MRDEGLRTLDGRFQLLELIGEGSLGLVYRAWDHHSAAQCAVKLLRDSASEPEQQVRMVREARAMAALAGTAAVQVYAFGTDVDGSFYIVMELLHGLDLEHYLLHYEQHGTHVPIPELVALLDPIVATLEAAHDRGIVHRDLKPSNIFLLDAAHGGGVRLLDFGLVKLLGAKPLTRHGFVAGTPSYIAPEAWRGEPGKLDHRIDVYAFGAIVWRALSGKVVFDAPDLMEKLRMVTSAERPSLHALRPDLSPNIDIWIKQSLAIDPERRFTRVRAMWTAFRHVVGC